jgi:hypothetical protein
MAQQPKPQPNIGVAVKVEGGVAVSRTIYSTVPIKGGTWTVDLGPFPADHDPWPEYEAEARRIGISDKDIEFARRHWGTMMKSPPLEETAP